MVTHLQNLDYIAIGIYILLMAGIGLSFGWFIKDTSAYFKGNSTVPWYMAAISNFMALKSSFVFVAYAGIAYQFGLVSITVFWSTVPAVIIGSIILAKRWRRAGLTTPIEYLETRYNLSVRQIVTWFGLIMRFLDNMVRLYAIGLFITVATPLSLEWSIVIAGIIVTVFNIIGGVWSVIVMGTVQFFILILATLILLPLSYQELGGLDILYQKIPEHMTWFNGPKGNLFWLFVFYVMILIKYNENWTFIQRFNCVRDEKQALKVGVVTGILFFIFTPVFFLPALAARVILPNLTDPEMSYVALSLKLLPAGIMGILFSSMFAATMSALNAEYNVMAGVLTNDVYKRLINPNAKESSLLWVARISTGLIGMIMIMGAVYIKHFGGAFEANKLFTGILAIPIGVPLLLGILFKKPNSLSSILTILIGVIAGIVLNTIPTISWELATIIETILCLLFYFIPAYLMTEEPQQMARTDAFFTKIKTPLTEAEKPTISQESRRSMLLLFMISAIVAGGLFISMSIPSINIYSGQLSFVSGVFCLIVAVILWIISRKK